MPTIYSMDYYGDEKVDEKLLIDHGVRLYNHVCSKHEKKPHVFGVSLGCAVSIGVLDKLGENKIQSLTLLDPFHNFVDMARIYGHGTAKKLTNMGCVGAIAGWKVQRTIRNSGKNCWYSDQKIGGAAFKKIPICVLSGTADATIPAKFHNEIYAKAVGASQVPAVYDPTLPPGWVQKTSRSTGETYYRHKATKKTQWERPIPQNYANITTDKNDVGTARMLVEIPSIHISPVWSDVFSYNDEVRSFYHTYVVEKAARTRRATRSSGNQSGNSKWLLWFIPLIIAVVLAIIGVIWWFCRTKSSNEGE